MSDTIEHSSRNMAYRTPPRLLSAIDSFDRIALDPCAPEDNNVGALSFVTEKENGLVFDWRQAGGLVFMNPPYSRQMREWVEKAGLESERGVETIALLPARLGTDMWQRGIRRCARSICVLAGRLTFWEFHPETGIVGPAVSWNKRDKRWDVTPAGFDSALVYWGKRRGRFEDTFASHGMVFRL